MIGLSVAQFKTWYRTMRTSISKLTEAGPSGSDTRKLTERNELTLKMYGFLQTYIVRLAPKHGVSLKQKIATAIATTTAADDSSGSNDEEADYEGDAGSSSLSRSMTPLEGHVAKPKYV